MKLQVLILLICISLNALSIGVAAEVDTTNTKNAAKVENKSTIANSDEQPVSPATVSNKASTVTAAAATQKPTATNKSKASPYSYQASEHISEDLSVAFPIDI